MTIPNMTALEAGENNRPTRVLLTSTSYPSDTNDWRGVFIRHMVTALAARDDIALGVWAPPGPMPLQARDATTPGERIALAKLMAEGGISHLLRRERIRGLREAVRLIMGLRRAFRVSPADVYHVNWLQCALPLPSDSVPLLVTVLGNDMRLLELPGIKAALRRVMRKRKVAICPNADWMAEPLQKVFGTMALIRTVPFGIDPRWYDLIREPSASREWLVVTRLTARKLGPLFRWCEPLFAGHPGRVLHLIGPMQESVEIPAWVRYHGTASPDELREKWFPRAAGLLTLSEHDEGRPQVLLEAMASGLPIIASRLPAHVDLISHDRDGLIVESPEELALALDRLDTEAENDRMGLAGRASARLAFGTWADCAARYATLYATLQTESPHDR